MPPAPMCKNVSGPVPGAASTKSTIARTNGFSSPGNGLRSSAISARIGRDRLSFVASPRPVIWL